MLVKTETLIGRALDWMVTQAIGKVFDGPFRPSRLREHGDTVDLPDNLFGEDVIFACMSGSW